MPALNDLATTAFDGGRTYGDAVHFVHVYVVEPHPLLPDLSPYTGREAENEISCRQARTYAERLVSAARAAELLGEKQTLLVDGLGTVPDDNAVWCTYGPAPNSAYIIDRSGVVTFSQLWVDARDLRLEVDRLLDR